MGRRGEGSALSTSRRELGVRSKTGRQMPVRCLWFVPISTPLSGSEGIALHPLWHAQIAISSSKTFHWRRPRMRYSSRSLQASWNPIPSTPEGRLAL